jgi:hypothetical protein
MEDHLEDLTDRFPMDKFENEILHYTVCLQDSQDPPLLVQLENGEVTGLSARETEALKQRVRFPL